MSVIKTKTKVIQTNHNWKVYIFLSQWKLKVKRETCLKRGKIRVTKWRLFLVLNLIGWEDGAGFLDQSQSKVKSIYSLKAPTLIFNTNALCCRLLPISAYDLLLVLNLIGWEDGAGFLDQSQSKVKSIYTLKAPTLIFNTNTLCCRLLPISAYDLKVSHNC